MWSTEDILKYQLGLTDEEIAEIQEELHSK